MTSGLFPLCCAAFGAVFKPPAMRVLAACKFERHLNLSFPLPLFLLIFHGARFLSAWMRFSILIEMH
jgi:hypothetical protein